MFLEPAYTNNSFSVVFQRHESIRRLANEFEDRLVGHYSQPQVVPVPDELDPEVPRLIFGSRHGFSQILVSQISLVLNVNYSPDWQHESDSRHKYLQERAESLFGLLTLLEDKQPLFCGVQSRVQIPCEGNDADVIHHLSRLLLSRTEMPERYDLEVKQSRVVEHKYFSNVTIRNYRKWRTGPTIGPVPMRSAEASERGVEVLGDFNDRFAFNEIGGYRTEVSEARRIITEGLGVIGGEANSIVMEQSK